MHYYAHSIPNESKDTWQSLKSHAESVADLVEEFSSSFCESGYARNLGLLHDVGKYQKGFQDYLCGHNSGTEHSICGAQLWMEYESDEAGAYCIAGHHTGLPDGGTIADIKLTLLGRLKGGTQAFDAYKTELSLFPPCAAPYKNSVNLETEFGEKEYALWIRMLFSSLTDGDCLDTERVYAPEIKRGIPVDFSDCLKKIEHKLNCFSVSTSVNKARHALRMQMLEKTKEDSGIYLLNLPTGAGKTLSSMEFALHRAIKTNKKRIIYVIPYTSIIEQNAEVFRKEIGDCILEHHCNFNYQTIKDDAVRTKLQHAAENWDADIIVTTNVQFFQSIYGNMGRDVRKLHNIAESIVIFDEVHMLPSNFYLPCLEAIKILVTRYHCEALLMSATMPDFHRWFKEFQLDDMKTLDLISDKSPYEFFRRCKIESLGTVSLEKLLQHIPADKSTLIVVNKKKTAKKIYDQLQGKKFHLSTSMTQIDRKRTIQKIREMIGKEPITVISTSLIEVGVDLDFDQVYREAAGLENLLQTAGRCNREGEKTGCVTYHFAFSGDEYLFKNSDIQLKQNCLQEIFDQYEDVSCEQAITAYFNRFYSMIKKNMECNDTGHSMDWHILPSNREFFSCGFRSYAEKFQLIADDGRTVVILCKKSAALIEQLCPENARMIKRKLQFSCVDLRLKDYEWLIKQGKIKEKCGVEYLTSTNYYNPETGLNINNQ